MTDSQSVLEHIRELDRILNVFDRPSERVAVVDANGCALGASVVHVRLAGSASLRPVGRQRQNPSGMMCALTNFPSLLQQRQRLLIERYHAVVRTFSLPRS